MGMYGILVFEVVIHFSESRARVHARVPARFRLEAVDSSPRAIVEIGGIWVSLMRGTRERVIITLSD